MLRICEKLREADGKARRIGLVRTETDYLRALSDAIANMDRSVEAEVLKNLGDVNLEKGKRDRDEVKLDMALTLYKTALLRCEDKEIGESLWYRLLYVEKLRSGKPEPKTFSVCSELDTVNKEMPSLANVAEKFQRLDHSLTLDHKNDTLLIEYTALMIEGIVNEDNVLEVEATKSLGDVYLKRGTENRNTSCLTKATALYNTALARCEGRQGRMALVHRLLYTARIRQDINRTGNKITEHKRKGQQQGHLSRNIPVTSANNDVIAGGPSQEFLSPSDFIASQTSRKPAPDYRSYEKYLKTGNHALAHGNLDLAEQKFVSALKLIHDRNDCDRPKEADCLYKLGDVFVRRGKATKDGKKFTQAAALYNAALARTDSVKHKEKLSKVLQETEKSFLQYTADVETKSSPIDHTSGHKKRLKEMRTHAKSQLEDIDQRHNPYQYDEDEPIVAKVEAERADAVRDLFKNIAKDRQEFIKYLVDECIDALGPPPCKYAFIGLGSQATELVTPYSDLEFAILIEEGKDNDISRRYFLNLTHYLHLKVINLGETILPAMAIPSLNDFQSEDREKKWSYYDSVTPRGFAFDGSMPWASKTPFGRDKTKEKPAVSLIQTPAKMAEFQRFEISLAEGYHLSDILRRVAFLAGDEMLVQEYTDILAKIRAGYTTPLSMAKRIAPKILREDREKFQSNEPTGRLLNVKNDMYRFPGIAIDLMALCCQTTQASTWDIIEALKATERITEKEATHLTVLISIAAELRLRTYIANGGQQDNMSPLAELDTQSDKPEMSDATLKSIFHIPDTKALFRYYCTAEPLKKCVRTMVADVQHVQPKRIFKETIYDISNQCRGRIERNLLMYEKSTRSFEAALEEVGDSDSERLAKVIYELGKTWLCRNDYSKAIHFFDQSASISKTIVGKKKAHGQTVSSLINLGMSYHALGDIKKAIMHYEQAIAMTKSFYGDDITLPTVATAFDNLGTCYKDLGDLRKALSYCEQALEAKKGLSVLYEDDKTGIVITLQNVGNCLCDLGDQKKAIGYFEESLTMLKDMYGDSSTHPHIATALQNLGICWNELGDQTKAIGYFEQSERILTTLCGGNTIHPEIAHLLNSLGSSWSHLGDKKKAAMYYEKSLKMKKAIYGDKTPHPGIASSLNNLGLSYMDFGDHRKALRYFEESLAMRKTIYGKNAQQPHITLLLTNLGSCWSNLGDERKAISYHEQSLTMLKSIYGDGVAHPYIAKSLHNLGVSWHELGDHKKAISYCEQSVAIHGDKAHPGLAGSFRMIGLCLDDMGDHRKAIKYHERALMVMKALYGDTAVHPDIAVSLNNLGASWATLGNERKAVIYFEQALTMKRAIYGEQTAHPEIVTSLRNLGMCWRNLGDHQKSRSYFEQYVMMQKTLRRQAGTSGHSVFTL